MWLQSLYQGSIHLSMMCHFPRLSPLMAWQNPFGVFASSTARAAAHFSHQYLQLPLESYHLTKPSRTPRLAGQPPSPGVSTTVFEDGHHRKHQQPWGHRLGQWNHEPWPTQTPQGFDWSSVELGSWRFFWQAFQVNSHYMFGFIRSVQQLPQPSDLIQQVVNSWHLSSSSCLKYTDAD